MKTNRSVTARLLAGSTHPDLLTAANTRPRQNSRLKGDQLMQAVGQQSWDVSVKGLAQFPDVINQMATNPSWTSELRAAGRHSEEQHPTKRGRRKPGAGLRSRRHAINRNDAGEVRLCSNCNPSRAIDFASALVGSSGHQLRSLLQRVQCSCPRCVDCR